MNYSGFIRQENDCLMRDMNPIIVIAAFVILLGLLLYYLQRREPALKTIKKKTEETKERHIIKASEYQAQYEKEKVETESETPAVASEQEVIEAESPIDDISQLEGVGPKYQELLRVAGYSSIKQIAESNPEELHTRLIETNKLRDITKRPPTMKNIEEWKKSANSKKD